MTCMRQCTYAGWLCPYQPFVSDSSLFDQSVVICPQICFRKKYSGAYNFRFNDCIAQEPSITCCREMQVEFDKIYDSINDNLV